jgi:L,D-transpeptidase catalytic domain
MWIRMACAALVIATIIGFAVGRRVAQHGDGTTDVAVAAAPNRHAPSATAASTSTLPPTTTTTIPDVKQPAPVVLPSVPGGTTRPGDRSMEVATYEQRLVDLHLDPGPVDGHFDQNLRYAVEAVEKMHGWERNGIIDQPFVDLLATFQYPLPLVPAGEADRVEIDLDRQVLTVYKSWQVALISTTSTGNGRRFCGGADGCQYAITPTGRYQFQWHVNGWRDGDLGRLYNPWYFNGGIAVHGYPDVPTHPASHGCARIPMHVSEVFGSLVHKDKAIYVLGTQAAPSGSASPPAGSPAPASTAPVTTSPAPTTPPTAVAPPPVTAPTTTTQSSTTSPTTAAPTTTAGPPASPGT